MQILHIFSYLALVRIHRFLQFGLLHRRLRGWRFLLLLLLLLFLLRRRSRFLRDCFFTSFFGLKLLRLFERTWGRRIIFRRCGCSIGHRLRFRRQSDGSRYHTNDGSKHRRRRLTLRLCTGFFIRQKRFTRRFRRSLLVQIILFVRFHQGRGLVRVVVRRARNRDHILNVIRHFLWWRPSLLQFSAFGYASTQQRSSFRQRV